MDRHSESSHHEHPRATPVKFVGAVKKQVIGVTSVRKRQT